MSDFAVPVSLSPSRVDSFTSCPLQFRFASIEKLPSPSGAAASKGSLVHRALELLFCLPAADRTAEAAHVCLAEASVEWLADEEFVDLALDEKTSKTFFSDATKLVNNYLKMEDPTAVHEVGVELRLEANIGDLALRGIIDRLDLENGNLTVCDYKSGRPPFSGKEQGKMNGVNFYAFLCQEVLGHRPAKVRLLYLSSMEVIESTPTEQSVQFFMKRTGAVLKAIERACLTRDFRAKPSKLCDYCAFKPYCPAHGGDPDTAAAALGPRS